MPFENACLIKVLQLSAAYPCPLNERSWKLLEALGFQREAYFRKNVYFWKDENGKVIWKDTYVYAKLNAEE